MTATVGVHILLHPVVTPTPGAACTPYFTVQGWMQGEPNNLLTREDLKKKLPKKVMHQTLNVILKYLEDGGKILDGRKGILWIYNPSPKLDKAIAEGVEL